jgi:glyoxylase-like metal-dependent hydrolase (beta-lactamase superfamily II)
MPTYSFTLLRAGSFRLDGGSMFGLIPRSVWSRSVPVDDKGRITVQHNCLLLKETPTPGATPRTIIIETGTGDKLDAASRELFVIEYRSIISALQEVSCDPSSISHAFVSHLHFDHAGGLTRLPRAGETPEWTGPAGGMAGSRPDHAVVRTFPNAKLVVQRREWEDALANRSLMTRTYFHDHLLPMKDHLQVVDSDLPYERWRTPDRDEQPKLRLEQRWREPVPGIFTFLTPGHTWGQQAVLFQNPKGQWVCFVPDCLPTRAHAGAAYSLAYDVEPYTSMMTKQWLLREASERNWLLVLDHEPANPLCTVKPNGKGWWTLDEAST